MTYLVECFLYARPRSNASGDPCGAGAWINKGLCEGQCLMTLQAPGFERLTLNRRRRSVEYFFLIAKVGTVSRDTHAERNSQAELESKDWDSHQSAAVCESAAEDTETDRDPMPARSWCFSSGAAKRSGECGSSKSRSDGLVLG